jgi:tripartite-type tricarboxylate transporter receptor subunit TctC
MGAKRQAKKQFEKELELEKLRNKSAATQQRKEIQQAKFDAMTPEELAKYQASEIVKWAKVVRESGARAE